MLLRSKNSEDVCKEYLEELKRKRRKLSTRANYHFKIYKYILPNIPSKIKKVQYEQCEELIYTLQEETLSNKTINDIIILLNSILKFALQKKYIKKNIKIAKLEYSPNTDIVIFTDEEQTKLVNYILSHLNYFNFSILLALSTGVRIGELSALTIDNLKDDYININHTLQRVKNIDCKNKAEQKTKTIISLASPKGKKTRKIPLLDICVNMRNKLLYPNCSFIVTGKKHYYEPRQIQRKYQALLKKCNIEYKRFHILRHTFAMNCVRNNIPLKVLAEWLGHADEATTEIYYIHFDFLCKKKMLNKTAPSFLILSELIGD